MNTLSLVFVWIVAVAHAGFLTLEMFLWRTPFAMRAFKLTPEFAEQSAALAANQGLYNGFIAAGLVWSAIHPVPEVGRQIAIFFLVCVLIAAAYGAWSVSSRILFIQGLPALIALALVLASRF